VTTFAQVSDLHFGRHDPRVAEALLRALNASRPAVVILSGDLTQRAFAREFRAARAWLDRLEPRWLAVPGNHDIPLYDVVRRLLSPLGYWHRYVTADMAPFFTDGQVAILGLNSARRNRWKEGRIADEQIEVARQRFCSLPPAPLRVLVTHHPFLPAPEDRRWTPMQRAEEALDALADCHLDLLLSGHQHRAYSADVERHYEKATRRLLAAHSGTSISTRFRGGEPNTWNWFEWADPDLRLEVRTLVGSEFVATGRRTFRRGADGWRTLPAPQAPAHETARG
jgi:3',5'-cyclic AMP phosphodiesterase CpdA